jgi:hypothetical protein
MQADHLLYAIAEGVNALHRSSILAAVNRGRARFAESSAPNAVLRVLRIVSHKAGDLVQDELSISPKEPAPTAFVIFCESHGIPDDRPVIEDLLGCDLCGVGIGSTGDGPRPRREPEFDCARCGFVEMQVLVVVPPDHRRHRYDGLSIRVHGSVHLVDTASNLESGDHIRSLQRCIMVWDVWHFERLFVGGFHTDRALTLLVDALGHAARAHDTVSSRHANVSRKALGERRKCANSSDMWNKLTTQFPAAIGVSGTATVGATGKWSIAHKAVVTAYGIATGAVSGRSATLAIAVHCARATEDGKPFHLTKCWLRRKDRHAYYPEYCAQHASPVVFGDHSDQTIKPCIIHC